MKTLLFLFIIALSLGCDSPRNSSVPISNTNTTAAAPSETPKSAKTVSEYVEVFNGMSPDSGLVTTISKGETIQVTKTAGNWSFVEYKKMKGWTLSKNLK